MSDRLNDLTLEEYAVLCGSVWQSEWSNYESNYDNNIMPTFFKDCQKLISLFTKEGEIVFDPMAGLGTVLLAAHSLGRNHIGFDITDYSASVVDKFIAAKYNSEVIKYHNVNAANVHLSLINTETIDYILTYPPCKDIPEPMGLYKESINDLGKVDNYFDYILALDMLINICYIYLKPKKYMSFVVNDFKCWGVETPFRLNLVQTMQNNGFEFCGDTVLLPPPMHFNFEGYPEEYKISHRHQHIMTFRKESYEI